MTIPWLDASDPFPPVERALKDPNGLLAAGGDLSPERLIDAYTRGIFPWFSEDEPPLWWSPDPRMVLYVSEVHISRSLRRTIESGQYRLTFDAAFEGVMAGCAAPRPDSGGTWITPEMTAAYRTLADQGSAHSVETWADGELAGGLYGVAIGRMFYGESMFSRRADASKVALVCLARQLERWGFELVDCQMSTRHLASMGARDIPRAEFLSIVKRLVRMPAPPTPWRFEEGLMKALSTMK
jgi:leucyl/phenylalanyl-tRNA--protein transferase